VIDGNRDLASAPHAPRWTTAVVCAGLVGGALLGCRARPPRPREDAFLDTRAPVARLDSVVEAADTVRLRLADARTLLGVVSEAGFAARLPRDTMTIAEILAWARADRARKDSAGASTTAVERHLDSLLAVTVVNKSYLPKDPEAERYADYISLTFAYLNKAPKAIRAFEGDVAFLDVFGDTIYSAHLKVDGPIGPGQTRREPGRIIKYNPLRVAHQRLRNTALSKLKVVWQPSAVIFADGTRVSLTDDRDVP